MKHPLRNPARSSGFMMLEALIAILIFSLGVVGMIGLQAVSAKNSTSAKYRSEAVLLVNQLIGKMWASDRTVGTLQASFNTGGTAYNAWLSSVASTLPGVVANSATAPSVSVNAAGVVSIAVYWVAPGDGAAAVPHNITTVTQIR